MGLLFKPGGYGVVFTDKERGSEVLLLVIDRRSADLLMRRRPLFENTAKKQHQ
jgi:hypothetical protein